MTTTHTQPAGCDLDSLPAKPHTTYNGYSDGSEPLWTAEQMEDYARAAIAARAAQAPQGDTRQGAPSDYVLMPKRLTAENGAKAALSGEFKESVEVTCPTCDGSGDDPDFDGDPTEHGSACLECNGDGTVAQNVPVSWDTIKDIYKATVALLATPAAHTCAPADERELPPLPHPAMPHGSRDYFSAGQMFDYARAAQGAGTVPAAVSQTIDVCTPCQGTGLVQHYLGGKTVCLDCATPPAPVSTAAAPEKTILHLRWRQEHAEWRECMSDCLGAVEFVAVVPAGYVGVAPAATEQQASTMASASDDYADLNNTAKEALHDLSRVEIHLDHSDAPTTIKNSAMDVRLCIKELQAALKKVAAPSRAADGQQGEDATVIDYGTPADGQQGASRMTERKTKEIGEREGMALAGYVLQSDDGRACIVHQGAVRWLSNEELWSIVHPADGQQGASRAAPGELRSLLQEFVDYHTKPAGMTLEVALSTDKLGEFLVGVESREKEMVQRACAALALPAQGAVAASTDEPDWRGFLEMWAHDGALQTFSSRERFRKEATALARAPLPAQADGQAVDDARDAWQPIETAPADCLLLLAYEFDRPGDWRIKVGGYWNGEWEVFGASWTPTRWSALPPVPNVSDYEARRAAQSRAQSDTTGDHND